MDEHTLLKRGTCAQINVSNKTRGDSFVGICVTKRWTTQNTSTPAASMYLADDAC